MPKPVVWHHFEGEAAASAEGILRAFASAEVETVPLTPDAAGRYGVVFLRSVAAPEALLLRRFAESGAERLVTVVVPPARLTAQLVWQLLRAGASEAIEWDDHSRRAAEIAAKFRRWAVIDEALDSPRVRNNLIGRSSAWIAVLREIVEVAIFTDATIHIQGESGTGKELVARLIHSLDTRTAKKELIVLDCSTLVPELSGSEFFGHERGAFTGAVSARDGAFAMADGGTLFLDEVGELPPALQAQLLRAVQERTYKRVGGNTWQTTNFRLVSATNRNLKHEVEQGRFRADLYYRLAACTCTLPPLRERAADIIPLVTHFLSELLPGRSIELDQSVREYVLNRAYPGNIRELKQLACRIAYRHTGDGRVTPGDVPENERPYGEPLAPEWRGPGLDEAVRRALGMGVDLKDISRGAVETAIRIAVEEEGGSLQRAARRLGITDRALQMRRAVARELSGKSRAEAAGS